MTIQAGEGSFDGIVCNEVTYVNCVIKGKITIYGKANLLTAHSTTPWQTNIQSGHRAEQT